MLNFLPGSKTYIVGFIMIAYAAAMFALGEMPQDAAVQLATNGFGFIFLRKAVS